MTARQSYVGPSAASRRLFSTALQTTAPLKSLKRRASLKSMLCFSKQMIQKQMRREYVAAVEEKLKRHPLAMYPHYKDHMTPELFDKVVSVLDPDLCINSASSLTYAYSRPCRGGRRGRLHRANNPDVQNPSPRNPYILQMNGNGIKKCLKVKANQLSNREDTKTAAKLFSRWFVSPNEELSVTESAIRGTFSQ
ncbi:uncharacterized protein zgc:158260 [Lates calcarifer]|uniref:Uncharacterized protein zgc:158260 n=1 Tax=Lates calcarifer TaxID=8187 RepID=A0AAJ7PFV9_LATCA|nr:uncharacterized protein zgc:158260 [Lates calcarifer]